MYSIANTTVTIYRGSSVDSFGDEDDTGSEYLSNVPASLIEQTRYVTLADSPTPQTVRLTTARLPSGTDVTAADRLVDDRTGKSYTISSVSSPGNPLTRTDLRLDLKASD